MTSRKEQEEVAEDLNEQTPHHGPITPGCPLQCLRAVLSPRSFNRLDWAHYRPETVGDVLTLYASGELPDINGLGPRGISEITTALVFAGLDITGRHPPTSAPGGRA